MNKKNILVLGTTLGFLGLVTASLATASPLLQNALGEQQSYGFAFNATHNRLRQEATPNATEAEGDVLTGLGNPITFAYQGLAAEEGKWQSIAQGGYITNIDPIGGLTSITIHKSASSKIAVYWDGRPLDPDNLSAGWNTNYTGTQTEITCVFASMTPTYFAVSALNDASIEDMTLSFSCHNQYPTLHIDYDENAGSVRIAGTPQIGSFVTLKATPNEGYSFLGWYVGETRISGDTTYAYYIPECIDETSIEARFALTSLYKGAYPQTKVTDASLVAALSETAGETPTEGTETLGKWTSYNYYIERSVSHFMWYADIQHTDGNKYRGVYFTSYRPDGTQKASPTSGSIQGAHGYAVNTVHWFKYERIHWNILDATQSGQYFVLADVVLDAPSFQHNATKNATRTVTGTDPVTGEAWNATDIYDNNWKYSDLRTFANSTFYNTAFSAQEKTEIVTKEVDNSLTSTGDTTNPYLCENTQEKVIVLSKSDVSGMSSSLTRYATDYAKCMGAQVSKNNGATRWWMRSPRNSLSSEAWCVRDDGSLTTEAAYYTMYGFVPAAYFTL